MSYDPGYGDWLVDAIARRHDLSAGIAEEQDSDVAIEVPPNVMANLLFVTMEPSPATVWCRTRKCGHQATKHREGMCMVPNCECTGLTA